MVVGLVVGQNIVGVLNKVIILVDIKSVLFIIFVFRFYVVKDGNFIGLFDIEILKIMVVLGDLLFDSLVWKEGMFEWGLVNK